MLVIHYLKDVLNNMVFYFSNDHSEDCCNIFFLGKGAFSNVYACRKNFSRKKYAAKIVEFSGDNKLKWETENEIEVCMFITDDVVCISC